MKVKSIMATPVVTVEMDDELSTAYEIFANTKFHHLLVIENNQLQGIVTDRDLFKALSPKLGTAAEKMEDLATLKKRIHQVMSRNPITVGVEDNVFKAIELFENEGISCLPVVDSKYKPVGIVSWRDIFKCIRKPK